ncbi:MAG TPA: CPBP family intramembrane glutamic endopeptidase [Puia sp.]|jgi:hypothetical protein
MKAFIIYLRHYLQLQSRKSFLLTFLFVALLVTLNYTLGIERRILAIRPRYLSWVGFVVFYGGVLAVAWGLQNRFRRKSGQEPDGQNSRQQSASVAEHASSHNRKGIQLLCLAPLYFATKMIHWDLGALLPSSGSPVWDHYTQVVLQLPAKLLLLLILVYGCWKTKLLEGHHPWEAVGLTGRNFNARPYFFLLLLLVPIIGLASTQHDFLQVYPKVKNIAGLNAVAHPSWPWKLLYELSYGSDFLSIELFFRGLLVVGLARYAGADVILPMAAFYCTIHFGKPLGECISSFFGGLILGVLAMRTRSILGGLMVHLGLAWMMEIGGWLGNLYF